jgi:hypothetical protein
MRLTLNRTLVRLESFEGLKEGLNARVGAAGNRWFTGR